MILKLFVYSALHLFITGDGIRAPEDASAAVHITARAAGTAGLARTG